jgi:hypothetical protein
MELPNHLRADIRQGMNPDIVLAVHCCRCEKYIKRFYNLESHEDPDSLLCEDCELALEEESNV